MRFKHDKTALMIASALLLAGAPLAQTTAPPVDADLVIAPFSTGMAGKPPPAPWSELTVKRIARHTRYLLQQIDGKVVLEADARASYSNLSHPLQGDARRTPWLSWRWRLDKANPRADLTHKRGDDSPARVCALFDLPLSQLRTADRMRIELGRELFDPNLPSAGLCYVWDATLAPETVLPNAYTDRVRMIVLRSSPPGAWFSERRDLQADFARAFPDEAVGQPLPFKALMIAADADDTGGASRAYFGDVTLSAH